MGNKWVIADGNHGQLGGLRDLSISLTLGHVANALADPAKPVEARPHEAGKAIGNFFYRLYQKGVMTPLEFMRFLLRTMQRIDDWGSNGLSLEDLYETLQMAAGNNTAIQNAVNQVWSEMEGPMPGGGNGGNGDGGNGDGDNGDNSGGGNGGVPPSAPGLVNGYWSGCAEFATLYEVQWSPVPNADSYRGYLQTWYGEYTLDVTTWPASVTSAPAYTYVDARTKMEACNGNGCSGPSTSTFYMPYRWECSQW